MALILLCVCTIFDIRKQPKAGRHSRLRGRDRCLSLWMGVFWGGPWAPRQNRGGGAGRKGETWRRMGGGGSGLWGRVRRQPLGSHPPSGQGIPKGLAYQCWEWWAWGWSWPWRLSGQEQRPDKVAGSHSSSLGSDRGQGETLPMPPCRDRWGNKETWEESTALWS